MQNHSRNQILIIECNIQITEKERKLLFDILNKILVVENTNKKIILISKRDDAFARLFKNNKIFVEYKNDEVKFDNFSIDTQNSFRDKVVILHGKQMSLGEFIPENDLQKILNEETLLKLLETEKIVIAPTFALSEFAVNCYIDRKLHMKRQIREDSDCFAENNLDIFAISCIDKNDFDFLIESNQAGFYAKKDSNEKKLSKASIDEETADSSVKLNKSIYFADKFNNEKNTSKYIVLDSNEQEARKQLEQLAQKFSTENIHYLKKENGKLIWQETYGSLAGVRKYIVGDKIDYDFDSIREKNVIISAIPGMGKSNIIDFWATQIIKNTAHEWIIKIDLKTKKYFIDKIKFDNIKSAVDFLSMVNDMTVLQRAFMQYFLEKTSEKLFLFLDGFDEISSEHQVKIINFMKTLRQESKNLKIVVATRQHMQEELENTLGVFAYNLNPFSEQNQINYLTKFWGKYLELSIQTNENLKKFAEYTKALLNLFSSSTKDTKLDFMGIPLQAWLLAEAFKKDFAEYYNNNTNITLPTTLDLIDLYGKFKNELYNIYLSKKENLKDLNIVLRDLFFDELTKSHRRAAFNFLFDEETNDFFMYDPESSLTQRELKRVGIIHEAQNKINFVHRTFAEYFVADLLATRLKLPPDHQLFKKTREFLLLHIFKARNAVILEFLNKMIIKTNDCNLNAVWKSISEALLNYNSNPENKIYFTRYKDSENTKNSHISMEAIRNSLQPYIEKTKSEIPVDKDEVLAFFPDFYDNLLKIKDLSFIEENLQKLSYIAADHKFNLLKEKILARIDDLIRHYLIQCMAQEGEINFNVLDAFSSISSNKCTTARGRLLAADVDNSIGKYTEKLKTYKKLKALIQDQNSQPNEFLSEENMLFLRIKNHNLNSNQFEELNKNRYKWWHNVRFSIPFRELYLQVDDKDVAEKVKQIYISESEIGLLKKLVAKFPELSSTTEEFERYDRSPGPLQWLESQGAAICVIFNTLNIKIVNHFENYIAPKNYKATGWHLKYATNIWERLILPIIDQQITKRNLKADKFALIKLFVAVIKFSLERDVPLTLNSNQLKFVLELITEIFNYNLLNKDILVTNIENILLICDALKLKLIEIENGILILEPNSEFSYEIRPNKPIIELIKTFNKEKNKEKLEKKCNDFILQAAQAQGKFTPQFNSILHQPENNIMTYQPPTKIRKLLRTTSDPASGSSVHMSSAFQPKLNTKQIAWRPSALNRNVYNTVTEKCANLKSTIYKTGNNITRSILPLFNNTMHIKEDLKKFALSISREGVGNILKTLAKPNCSIDGTGRFRI